MVGRIHESHLPTGLPSRTLDLSKKFRRLKNSQGAVANSSFCFCRVTEW